MQTQSSTKPKTHAAGPAKQLAPIDLWEGRWVQNIEVMEWLMSHENAIADTSQELQDA